MDKGHKETRKLHPTDEVVELSALRSSEGALVFFNVKHAKGFFQEFIGFAQINCKIYEAPEITHVLASDGFYGGKLVCETSCFEPIILSGSYEILAVSFRDQTMFNLRLCLVIAFQHVSSVWNTSVNLMLKSTRKI